MQVMPFPEYPELHAQVKLPTLFVQCAFNEHPPLSVEHSLTSFIINFLFIIFDLIENKNKIK